VEDNNLGGMLSNESNKGSARHVPKKGDQAPS
jgi:hypothetical protein